MTKDFVNNWTMTSKRRRPTEAELGILRVLWEGGPRSVRDIQRILNESRPTGYTTVLKLMQIMTDKGLVERDESQRPQIYRSRYSQEQTQRQLLRDLLDRAFGGFQDARAALGVGERKVDHEADVYGFVQVRNQSRAIFITQRKQYGRNPVLQE